MSAHDAVVWDIINNQFCSYKVKTRVQTFCKNQYNVTGLCNRNSCPLANSRYATVIEKDGVCYLYMKTIERAHTPANLWERVKLSKNMAQALAQIDHHLMYWPKFLQHRNKQRLVKIRQYLIKMRRLKLKARPKLVRVNKKQDRRDVIREKKALAAAQIENKIKSELIDRLKQNTYGEIYSVPATAWEEVMNEKEEEEEQDKDEIDIDSDGEEMEEEEGMGETEEVDEYIAYDDDDMEDGYEFEDDEQDVDSDQVDEESDSDVDSDSSSDESEDDSRVKYRGRGKRRRARVEVEYELEGATSRETARN